MRYRSTKRYTNLPCCHRQPKHAGHCRFIHGYSREVKFWFEAKELDENGFVVDFGSLKDLKAWLEHMFDHTMLINEDDPERELLEAHRRHHSQVQHLPAMQLLEGSAKYVFEHADRMVQAQTAGRCWVVKVIVAENEKNSAEYELRRRNSEGSDS